MGAAFQCTWQSMCETPDCPQFNYPTMWHLSPENVPCWENGSKKPLRLIFGGESGLYTPI